MNCRLAAAYSLTVLVVAVLAGATWSLSAQVSRSAERVVEAEGALRETAADIRAIHLKLDALDLALREDMRVHGDSIDQAFLDLRRELAGQIEETQVRLESVDGVLVSLAADVDGRLSELASQLGALEQQGAEVSALIQQTTLDAVGVYSSANAGVVEVRSRSSGGSQQGSGFVVGADARYVITADHVVNGANTITVITADGASVSADHVGGDPDNDVAVLRLSRAVQGVDALTFADSSTVLVGSPVLVIGSPLGLRGTATLGIVSATGRTESFNGYEVSGLIQIDAAVNSGNSGGPALNADGQVVGLVVARVRAAVGDGLNFAVPSGAIQEALASVKGQGQ